MSSNPLDIRQDQAGTSPVASSPARSQSNRHASIARLSSPVPSVRLGTTPQQITTSTRPRIDGPSPNLPLDINGSFTGPGASALTTALAGSNDKSTLPPPETSIRPPSSEENSGLGGPDRLTGNNYGSFDARETSGTPSNVEDPEIVKRYLVQQDERTGRSSNVPRGTTEGASLDDDEFSSLQLQGGDITRSVYRWAESADASGRGKMQRSQSFTIARPEPEEEVLNIHSIRVPGGFRRDYLRRTAEESPAPGSRTQLDSGNDGVGKHSGSISQPQLFTNNFLEFLTLYGHFAGEELEEDDEVLEPDEYFSYGTWHESGDDHGQEPGEDSSLLGPTTPGRRKRKHKERAPTGRGSATNAALLLLKSFVGTGVLFLPRAFYNGGMLFSSLVLLAIAALSFFCFVLLIDTRSRVEASFGDIGGMLYGKWMRAAILSSIVLSQVGFVAAYTVFTSENLQAFVLAVSKCKTFIDIKFMVLMQLIIFLPLSLIRDISKLGFTALIADVFIMLGLIYLYYSDISTIASPDFTLDIALVNPSSWTLFIGTAIFTFEGVGLIIPIQESMKHPNKFPVVLGTVMVIITILFTSIGALSYAAFGSKTKTVVLLNLPQDNKMVNVVQFLYSLAIVLSTPLQLFPAIRIMENELFTRSGKYNPYIKWQKNIFRFVLVLDAARLSQDIVTLESGLLYAK
ncbi:hypothetical protein DV738_g2573, partial [Chaetothyriales sp. CBS 135597]